MLAVHSVSRFPYYCLCSSAATNAFVASYTRVSTTIEHLLTHIIVYHLHVEPVPANGNCTATKAHLDQYVRGEDPACDPALPATCQDGDLSGKHGKPAAASYSQTYVDKYVSLQEGVGSFFGNRSIVFHYANKTRITCANFARGKLRTLSCVS